MVPLTKLGPDPGKTVYNILHEYKVHNADVLFRDDYGVDELIDVIEGNRKYIRCVYVWNKVRPNATSGRSTRCGLPRGARAVCTLPRYAPAD